ncbi:MAG: hypothetical protein WC551_02315 [Patescibacteria group bacterium]
MPKPRLDTLICSSDSAALFGELCGATSDERRRELENKYQGFALVLPVDAIEARSRLDSLYEEAKRKLGQEITASITRIQSGPLPRVITAFPGEFKLGRTLWQDTLCDMLTGKRTLDGKTIPCTARLSADAECNELIQREAHILSKLGTDSQTNDPFHGHFRRYLPTMLGAFTADEADDRNGILLEDLEDFRTLVEVRETYPDGVEFQTAVWMFNRLLEGLGYIHRQTVVHGGIIPFNVLIHPEDHAAKLIGWNAAVVDPVRTFDYVRLVHDDFREFYPPEILEKEPPMPATDIFMAAKCMVYILNGDMKTDRMPDEVPDYLRNFLKSCLIENPYQRPNDAWQVRDEFDQFMRDHYGPPRYHPFRMPERKPLTEQEED